MQNILGKLAGWMLALSLILAAQSAMATDDVRNPVDQLTGAIWMDSSADLKEAFLYGVECVITIEQAVASQLGEHAKKGGKNKGQTYTLSPFEKGWMTAFEGVSRGKIATDVDAWYSAHPEQLNRPVFAVLWHELIVPKMK